MNVFEVYDELSKLGVLDKENSTTSPLYLELNDVGFIEKRDGTRYVYSNLESTISIYFNELISTDNSEMHLFNNSTLVGVIECV